jgi:peptidoglycan/xylan/chitin deacetylase (PgdA/CDA1 family)
MLRRASKAVLESWLRQWTRLPVTRRAIHRVSVAARGPAIAFLRCRRLLPETAAGDEHPDRFLKLAMTPSELEASLRDIQKTLRFVHMAEALSSLSRGRRMPEGAAVLTFDESFAATAELALPVLRRLGVPCTLFVSTAHLDGTSTLWDEEVGAILEALAPTPLSLSWVDLVLRTDTKGARAAAARRLLRLLASLDEERLDKRLEELRARAGAQIRSNPLDRMLTAGELERLSRDSLVSVGAHGHRHLAFASITGAVRQRELHVPRALLRDIAGGSFVDVVSYPFGRTPYIDDSVLADARAAGYRAAFSAETGVARPGSHLFRLPRIGLGPGIRAMDAYELQGMSDAVDELLLVATGSEDRIATELEG